MRKNNQSILQGVIYVAIGKESFSNFERSYKSLAANTNTKITLFTDQERCLDDIDIVKIGNQRDPFKVREGKIQSILNTPYERTVYLDADTFVAGDITPMFSLLDKFDLAAAFSSQKLSKSSATVPDIFPEFNSGIFAYKIDKVLVLFSNWLKLYKQKMKNPDSFDFKDEPPFREALYSSDVRFAVLPTEWNYYIHFPHVVKGYVKILHGQGDLEAIEKQVNVNDDIRVFEAFK